MLNYSGVSNNLIKCNHETRRINRTALSTDLHNVSEPQFDER